MKKYIILSLISGITGVILFAYMKEILIIRYPTSIANQSTTDAIKKKIKLTFWHNNTWKQEIQELLWQYDTGANIHYVINSLLTLLDEEHAMSKKVNVQSVLLASSQHEAYISFDRNPFTKKAPTFEKLMFIESVLKTIRENNIPIQQILFLVHHKPLHDQHLDFSKAWPVSGFF